MLTTPSLIKHDDYSVIAQPVCIRRLLVKDDVAHCVVRADKLILI